MLFILRKIRRSFFLPGKVRTYMAYAAGEIVLIVVGILLALQVQTWNEGRRLARERETLIENLISDFEANQEEILAEIADAEDASQRLSSFMLHSDPMNSELSVDELRSLARSTNAANSVWPALGAYRTAHSTGSINLIQDTRLDYLFMKFEEDVAKLHELDRLHTESEMAGFAQDLRIQLGSILVLRGSKSSPGPDRFRLSDAEYRRMIAQKQVYAYYEAKQALKRRQIRTLHELEESTEEILAALEALE